MKEINKKYQYKVLLQKNLAAFTEKVFHTVSPGAEYLHNWHISLIAEYLEACRRREIKRLIINMPPRYLKSISTTIAFPAWLLAHNPADRVMCASYAERLAMNHSMDTRLVIQSPWYRELFPETKIAHDQNEKRKFITTKRGQRYATSVGGTATGDGGNFLIVDDPHNPTQALSDVQREQALNWFDQTFTSRLDDKKNGVIIVVMQRLHQNDLTGHLLDKGGWEHLCLPFEAEERTIVDFGNVHLVREVGDLLHPEREGPEQQEQLKKDLGTYAYSGQYQQRPTPTEGGIFQKEWMRRYQTPLPLDEYDIRVQSWDTAVKDSEYNDPSCCTTWGVKGDKCDLLHVMVERMLYPRLKNTVMKHASDWKADTVLIEDKASGQQLLQDLNNTTVPILPIMPNSDKITRALAESAMVEAGYMGLPNHASWLADYETELFLFPNATHDDQVDSTTQFLKWIKSRFYNSLEIREL